MKKRKLYSAKHREWLAGYLFAAPAVIIFLIFTLVPMLGTVYFSLTNYNFFDKAEYVGLRNFAKIFRDKELLAAIGHTVFFGAIAISAAIIIGILLAVLMNRKINPKLSWFYRLCFFLPYVVAYAYVSLIWSQFYATDTGIFNYYLGRLGLEKIGWLTDPEIAMVSIIIMDVWKSVGFFMIIFLAGLQNIPSMYYECASLDGANTVQKFFKITLPLLTPTIFFVLILTSISALQIFEPIQILTKGGPMNSTRSIVMYIYQKAFGSYNLGYASSISLLLFIAVVCFTFLQFYLSRKWVNYD